MRDFSNLFFIIMISIFTFGNTSVGQYRISDMIPVAQPPRVAGDGLEDLTSYFV